MSQQTNSLCNDNHEKGKSDFVDRMHVSRAYRKRKCTRAKKVYVITFTENIFKNAVNSNFKVKS